MHNEISLLVFSLGNQKIALYLSVVVQVIHSVEITPLPEAPEIVQGIINYHGTIIPVLDIFSRFNIPPKELTLNQLFIIAKTKKGLVAIIVDHVHEILIKNKGEIIQLENISHEIKYIDGIVKFEDGIILIHDINTFLSLDEQNKLYSAIEEKS